VAHDEWRASLRINHADPAALAAILIELPADGLQHAGSAIVAHLDHPALRSVASAVVGALTKRNWGGDDELAETIRQRLDGRASGLVPLPVDLDEFGDALEGSVGVGSLLNLDNGAVWPGQLLDIGEMPDGYDPDEPGRWITFGGLGSRDAYRDMERFAASLADGPAARVLAAALEGKGAFRRFRSALDRYPDHLTAWHRFSDDARLGRARAWLADLGYQPAD
jgi:Uncharacterised protein family (UPF0158)